MLGFARPAGAVEKVFFGSLTATARQLPAGG
jgi:hypothetical protein